MPLRDLLGDDRVAIIDRPADSGCVLDAAAMLLSGGDKAMARSIATGLRTREQLASTAIGHGVAIPHGRIATLDESRGAFLRLGEPVAFGALDGEPVDLVLALAVPEHYVQQHLHQLAELAEHFADAGFRAQLRAAADVAALSAVLRGPCAFLQAHAP